jgi:glutamate racemase
VIDSASATASALAGLLEIHSLNAPLDAVAEHVQLTTGDVDAFTAVAGRLFGSLMSRAEQLAIAGVVPVAGASAAVGE